MWLKLQTINQISKSLTPCKTILFIGAALRSVAKTAGANSSASAHSVVVHSAVSALAATTSWIPVACWILLSLDPF